MELFDSAAFGLSESEARFLDPQQRLLLMAAMEVTNTSSPSRLAAGGPRGACGVFVGASALDYSRMASRCEWAPFYPFAHTDPPNSLSIQTSASSLPTTIKCHFRYQPHGISAYTATGSLSLSVLPGRISYHLELTGPSVAVDTGQ